MPRGKPLSPKAPEGQQKYQRGTRRPQTNSKNVMTLMQRIWTQFYVRGLAPKEAADRAEMVVQNQSLTSKRYQGRLDCSGGRELAMLVPAMSRVPRAAAHAAGPSYPVWKADAVKALQKLHWSAAAVTRDALWSKLYVRGLSPEEAAKLAEREYHSTRPPDWVKRRR
jgi:hypothetical protein